MIQPIETFLLEIDFIYLPQKDKILYYFPIT